MTEVAGAFWSPDGAWALKALYAKRPPEACRERPVLRKLSGATSSQLRAWGRALNTSDDSLFLQR